MATIVHSLNSLLHQDVRWHWDAKCTEAFAEVKRALTSSYVQAHYNPSMPITLAGDASAYGVGATIFHTFLAGSECPIAFASKSLSTSELILCMLFSSSCSRHNEALVLPMFIKLHSLVLFSSAPLSSGSFACDHLPSFCKMHNPYT